MRDIVVSTPTWRVLAYMLEWGQLPPPEDPPPLQVNPPPRVRPGPARGVYLGLCKEEDVPTELTIAA